MFRHEIDEVLHLCKSIVTLEPAKDEIEKYNQLSRELSALVSAFEDVHESCLPTDFIETAPKVSIPQIQEKRNVLLRAVFEETDKLLLDKRLSADTHFRYRKNQIEVLNHFVIHHDKAKLHAFVKRWKKGISKYYLNEQIKLLDELATLESTPLEKQGYLRQRGAVTKILKQFDWDKHALWFDAEKYRDQNENLEYIKNEKIDELKAPLLEQIILLNELDALESNAFEKEKYSKQCHAVIKILEEFDWHKDAIYFNALPYKDQNENLLEDIRMLKEKRAMAEEKNKNDAEKKPLNLMTRITRTRATAKTLYDTLADLDPDKREEYCKKSEALSGNLATGARADTWPWKEQWGTQEELDGLNEIISELKTNTTKGKLSFPFWQQSDAQKTQDPAQVPVASHVAAPGM